MRSISESNWLKPDQQDRWLCLYDPWNTWRLLFLKYRENPTAGAYNSCSQSTRSFPTSYSNRVTGYYYTILQTKFEPCYWVCRENLVYSFFFCVPNILALPGIQYKRHHMFVILQYLEFYFRFRFGEIK